MTPATTRTIMPAGWRYELTTVKVRVTVAEATGSTIAGPKDAAPLLRAIFADLDADQEHFVLLALDQRHKVTGYKVVASGAQDSAQVDPRVVFRSALRLSAAAIIVAHNHPSGDPEPSADDRQITDRLERAGELLGMRVLDHIVLGDGARYASLKEGARP